MNQKILFEGDFDNGRTYYNVSTEVSVDITKEKLSVSEVVEIVQALERADRRLHGRSFRGSCIAFSVSTEELDAYAERYKFESDEDGAYIIPKEYAFLENYWAGTDEIDKAYSEEDEEV